MYLPRYVRTSGCVVMVVVQLVKLQLILPTSKALSGLVELYTTAPLARACHTTVKVEVLHTRNDMNTNHWVVGQPLVVQ